MNNIFDEVGAFEFQRTQIKLTGYLGLFLSALIAATILPAQSESVLVVMALTDQYSKLWLVLFASMGNILGSIINWFLGRGVEIYLGKRWFPVSAKSLEKYQGWYKQYGRWSLLASWVPIIGDPLTVAAGVMKEPLPIFVLLVTIAKTGRYIALLALTTGFN